MPQYLPITPPPGIYRHGVALEASGRWRDGNLVRWENGSVRAVGGWQQMLKDDVGGSIPIDIPTGVARGLHGWLDNGNAPYLAAGLVDGLHALDVTMTWDDITPVGFTQGAVGENLGYGGKRYGRGTYGTPRISDGVIAPSAVWSMDNWGEQLLAMTSADRTIYVWDLATATAEELTNSPSCNYMLVTAERFIFALGAGTNPRKIQWCDREAYTQWASLVTNEAGDIELVTQGALLGGCRVRGRTLLLTTTDAHIATYQGPPAVYGFQRVGTGCGLSGPNTLVPAGQGAFWMGENGFFMYDGSVVREIPCEVQDHVFQNINSEQRRKAWGVANEQFQEVWWFYPSSGSEECDKYVAFDYEEGHWMIGELSRTAGVDIGAYRDPVWIGLDEGVYFHESGIAHDGVQPFIESGPIMMGAGDQVIYANSMIQEEDVLGNMSVSFTTRYYPSGDDFEWGPYTLGNPTDIRISGRQLRMRLTAEDSTDWRIGGIRLGVEVQGRR